MTGQTIGARLRIIRRFLGFSQQEFAEKLNITQQSYSLLEKDRRSPNIKILKDLSRDYDIDLNWLVNGFGEMFYNIKNKNKIDEFRGKGIRERFDIGEEMERRLEFYFKKIEKLFLEKKPEEEESGFPGEEEE